MNTDGCRIKASQATETGVARPGLKPGSAVDRSSLLAAILPSEMGIQKPLPYQSLGLT